MTVINDFHGEHYWLDNMWTEHPITWGPDLTFNAVEQGFVYFKVDRATDRLEVMKIADPYEAKAFGRAVKMREDWDDIKFGVMYELVRRKFHQNIDLMKALLNTTGIHLVEGNTWDDNIWGDCYCSSCVNIEGQNFLGKTLMSVREQALVIPHHKFA